MNSDSESDFENILGHIFCSEIFIKDFHKSCIDIDSVLFEYSDNWDSSIGVDTQDGLLASKIIQYIDVILMCGIPGSGKSTWIKKYFTFKKSSNMSKYQSHKVQNDKEQIQEIYIENDSISIEIFSPDSILADRYNYQWTPKSAQEAWAESYQNFGKTLLQLAKQKQSYNHESTMDGKNQIKKGHKMSKIKKILIWDATFLHSIHRAPILHICRGMNFRIGCVFMDTPLQKCMQRNRKRTRPPVPDEKIKSMYKTLLPPSTDEGFDVIFHMKTK